MVLTEVQINMVPAGSPEFRLLDEKRKAEIKDEVTISHFNGSTFSQQDLLLKNYVVSVSAQPIGLASVFLHKDNSCMEITKFYVELEHRGVGYGDRLIDVIEEKALQQDVDHICVNLANCQPEVDGLFNKHGYQVIPNSEFGSKDEGLVLLEKIL